MMKLHMGLKIAILVAVTLFAAYLIFDMFDTKHLLSSSVAKFVVAAQQRQKEQVVVGDEGGDVLLQQQQQRTDAADVADEREISSSSDTAKEKMPPENAAAVAAEPMLNFSQIWPQDEDEEELPLCPEVPPGLKGNLTVADMRAPPLEELEQEYPELEPGGRWRPKDCRSRNSVAFIVPYRDRDEHLRAFLHNVHRMFQHQQLDYAIIVVDQFEQDLAFNRGRLLNIGFLEAMKLYPWQCVCLHDVDTIPVNDLNMYSCPGDQNKLRHLAVALDDLGNKLFYATLLGGVTIASEEQFRRANGFSNDFWGWGGEDDDLYTRVTTAGFQLERPSAEIARYKRFKHKTKEAEKNTCRFELLKLSKEKQAQEGVNNIRYRVRSLTFNKLYTHILVNLLHTEYQKFKDYAVEKIKKNC